jgi:26S proteasome regulatory subunit T6
MSISSLSSLNNGEPFLLVRLLREELQLLQEPGSYVGEVVKVMGKNKVLVKVQPEGKYSKSLLYPLEKGFFNSCVVVDIDSDVEVNALKATLRVALRSDSYTIHKILPNKVDPLVSLMMVEKVPDSTYEMVGGLDKQIKEIKEVIELPVKHPELFEALGIAQPKGVLLYGPPGTGKTLLARAVAHHTDCKFIRVSGSELVQKYIGEGSRMVRELFVMAREHAPSIIFMDEIDSIGSSRGDSGSGGGDSEVQRTMLELLNQLDGFESTKNIKVIMATNRIGMSFRLIFSKSWSCSLYLQISLIPLFYDQVVLIARSNFLPLGRRRVYPFSVFTPEKYV